MSYDTDFQAIYKCYSSTFVDDRVRTIVENGGKILLPQSALEQLVEHTDVMLFKLTNSKEMRQTHCGVLEFLSNDEPICYIPHWMMEHLLLDEGDEISIELVDSLPSATFVCFQPESNDFMDLTNPKAVLEKILTNFSCLTKGDVITINYLDRNYNLTVLELKPSDVVSIIDCDIEVDFATANTSKSNLMRINSRDLSKITSIFPTTKKSVSKFSSIRGLPNFNYRFGLLEFPRGSSRDSNENRNEIIEKDSSNTFQPFTGQGKTIRESKKST